MKITRERFIEINKYALIAGIAVYLVGIFSPLKALAPGILFLLGAGLFCLLHRPYFEGRPKLAAHIWLIPLVVGSLTYAIPMARDPEASRFALWAPGAAISAAAFLLLITGKAEHGPSRKRRLRIVNARILVQCLTFIIYAAVTAAGLIYVENRYWRIYWAAFHVLTTALLPFLFGRVLCSWICPNAALQDGLFKHLKYRRPIAVLPRAIEEQTHTTAMNISGEVDKRAPLLPATLLVCWFPMFFCETVFDLTQVVWYPIGLMYGLYVISLILPWRKACAHFCWLSSYRGLASHNSLWRIRFNRSKCRQCKRCKPEEVCPFFIDITRQDNEMPASCCVCFSCMESCPFEGVLTFRRDKEEKARLAG